MISEAEIIQLKTEIRELKLALAAANEEWGASHTGYMWLISNPEDQTTFFRYDPIRRHRVAHELFGNYGGILQTDGYEAYASVAKANSRMKLIHCMAHTRRKFMEAKDNDPPEAKYFLDKIQILYKLEEDLRGQNADYETRYREKQKTVAPILT